MPTDDEWQPGPPDCKFTIERWGHNSGWSRCAFTELRAGDVHRYFDPEGNPIHPYTHEVETSERHTMALCNGTPFKNMGIDSHLTNGEPIGYCVAIEVMEKDSAQ